MGVLAIKRWIVPLASRRTWLLMVALTAGASTIAVLALIGSGSGRSNANAGSDEANALKAFAIIRRSHTAADDPTPYVAEFSGANMAMARRALGFTSGEAWVARRVGSLCLVAESTTGPNGAAVCDDDKSALAGRMVLWATNPEAPGEVFIAGLVPDATTNVTLSVTDTSRTVSRTLPVHENVFMDEIRGSVFHITENGPEPVRVPINAVAPK
jgi:hypothetical protein